jgi:hypothetical protein
MHTSRIILVATMLLLVGCHPGDGLTDFQGPPDAGAITVESGQWGVHFAP